jgi:uncharacterized protein YkwD
MFRPLAILFSAAAMTVAMTASPAQALNLSKLIAPPSACAHQSDVEAAVAEQERAMRCMTNYARERIGRARLDRVGALSHSAEVKSLDILRCNSFSHYACGRDFTFWMRRAGYIPSDCWRAGENIAWGSGSGHATVRAIFKSWIRSPGHRDNILSHEFRELGVGLRIGGLGGHRGAHVWTQHFGKRC